MRRAILCTVLLFEGFTAISQTFSKVSPTFSPALPTSAKTEWVDLDNDGDLDLVAVSDVITIYPNTGSSTFMGINNPFGSSPAPISWAFKDYDMDMDIDFLLFDGTNLKVFINIGGFSFTPTLINVTLDTFPQYAYWLDIEGDGDLDIYIRTVGNPYILINDGTGNFIRNTNILPNGFIAMSWADVNNDGLQDFVGIQSQGSAYLFLNQDGYFKQSGNSFAILTSQNIEWWDMDNDGDLDLLASESNNPLMLYKNSFVQTSTAGFTPGYTFKMTNPYIQVGDVNLDGKPDILTTGNLVTNGLSQRKTFYYRNGSAPDFFNFTEVDLLITSPFTPTQLDLVDMDRDNDLDLFILGQDGASPGDFFRNNNSTTGYNPPSAPVSLQVNLSHFAKLSWSPVLSNGTIRYHVEVLRNGIPYLTSGVNGSSIFPERQNSSVLISPYLTIRYLPEGSYTWRVMAVDANDNVSGFSTQGPPFSIGAAVSGLVSLSPTGTTVQLNWVDTTPPASGFHILRKSEYLPLEEIAALSPNTFSYDATITTGENYYFVVQADFAGSYGAPAISEVARTDLFVKEPLDNVASLDITFAGIADLDNDDDYDIITAPNFIGIQMLKNTAGKFSQQPIGINQTGRNVIADDMDADGDIDICQVEDINGNMQIVIYENQNGNFTRRYAGTQYPEVNFKIADFNNDGRKDIFLLHLTTNGNSSNGFNLLFQESLDQFRVSQYLFVPEITSNISNSYTLADFNNDGFVDIFAPSNNGFAARFYKNVDGGNFEQILCNYPTMIASFPFDYNQDGFIDLAVSGGNSILFYKNSGNFSFSGIDQLDMFKYELFPPLGFYSGDVDLNGISDLIISTHSAVLVVQGFGNGEFRTTAILNNSGTATIPADLDGDGDLDIISPYTNSTTTSYLYRNSANTTIQPGNLSPAVPQSPAISSSNNGVRFSWLPSTDDLTPTAAITYNIKILDNNGKQVISPITNSTGHFRRVIRGGNVSGLFQDFPELAPGTYTAFVQSVDASYALSDFTSGVTFSILAGPANLLVERIMLNKIKLTWEDAVTGEDKMILQRGIDGGPFQTIAELGPNTTTYIDNGLQYNKLYSYRVCASLNNTTTTWSNQVFWNTNIFIRKASGIPNVSINIDIADLNQDGKMDFVDATKTWYENTSGGFVSHTIGSIPQVTSVKVMDINGDYIPDIIQSGSQVETLINDGSGSFQSSNSILTSSSYLPLYTWDFDSDLDQDLVVSTGLLLRNDGSGTYTNLNTKYALTPNGFPGDFDDNGNEDIFKVNASGTQLFRNTRNAADIDPTPALFGTNVIFQQAGGGTTPVDFNGDGLLDMFVTNVSPSINAKLYKNTTSGGAPTFALANSFITNPGFSSGWIDADLDGDLDLFILNPGPSAIVFYFNNSDGTFTPFTQPGVNPNSGIGNSKWIDIDRDGDLDLLMPGISGPSSYFLENQMISNGIGLVNNPPVAPTGLTSNQNLAGIHLSWTSPADDHTPSSALSYDVILYSGNKIITNSNINPSTGNRNIIGPGRISSRKLLLILAPGDYRWKVQAIDQSYAGSALSEEGHFTVDPPAIIPPVVTTGIEPSVSDIISVYPIPAENDVIIRIPKSNPTNIIIYQSTGTIMLDANYSGEIGEVAISTRNWARGLYLIKAINGRSEVITKLILR